MVDNAKKRFLHGAESDCETEDQEHGVVQLVVAIPGPALDPPHRYRTTKARALRSAESPLLLVPTQSRAL